jgi:hypothetical protein
MAVIHRHHSRTLETNRPDISKVEMGDRLLFRLDLSEYPSDRFGTVYIREFRILGGMLEYMEKHDVVTVDSVYPSSMAVRLEGCPFYWPIEVFEIPFYNSKMSN